MRRKLPKPEGPGVMPPTPDMDLIGYSVLSWSPDPVPCRSPSTAVVLMMEFKGHPYVSLRLSSRAAVDELIDALERQSLDVWGAR